MLRISGPTAVAGLFVPENQSTGAEPTGVTADWLNAVQEELATTIEGLGIALNPAQSNQLLNALLSKFAAKDTSNAFAGSIEASKAFSDTSNLALVARGNIAGLNIRPTTSGAFSILSGFASASSTTFLVGTGAANPNVTVLRIEHGDGSVYLSKPFRYGYADNNITYVSGNLLADRPSGVYYVSGPTDMPIPGGTNEWFLDHIQIESTKCIATAWQSWDLTGIWQNKKTGASWQGWKRIDAPPTGTIVFNHEVLWGYMVLAGQTISNVSVNYPNLYAYVQRLLGGAATANGATTNATVAASKTGYYYLNTAANTLRLPLVRPADAVIQGYGYTNLGELVDGEIKAHDHQYWVTNQFATNYQMNGGSLGIGPNITTTSLTGGSRNLASGFATYVQVAVF